MSPILRFAWILSAALLCDAGASLPDAREDPDWANHSSDSRRLNSCRPTNAYCTCTNENYPCYATYNNRCSCWGMDKTMCQRYGGQYCSLPDDCDFQVNGECLTEDVVFRGSDTSIHAKKNLVLLGNERVYRALRDGYMGTIPRHEAISFAVRAFLYLYSGDYDGIMVIPHERLSGSRSHGEHWHGHKEFKGRVISMISLQNYGRGMVGPYLHEIMHRWGIFLDFIDGVHWHMTAFDKHGMLGGFGRDRMECASGGQFPNCNGNMVRWDFDAGSAQTSHDAIGKYSSYDLLLMGVMSANEVQSREKPLVHCKNPSREWGSGLQTVSCGSLEVKTAKQVVQSMHPELEDLQIRRGRTLRFIALAILPTPDAVKEEKESNAFRAGSGLESLNEYIEATVGRFEEATGGRASISFTTMGAVEDADEDAGADEDATGGGDEGADGEGDEDTREGGGGDEGADGEGDEDTREGGGGDEGRRRRRPAGDGDEDFRDGVVDAAPRAAASAVASAAVVLFGALASCG